jgi:hypothetical protein
MAIPLPSTAAIPLPSSAAIPLAHPLPAVVIPPSNQIIDYSHDISAMNLLDECATTKPLKRGKSKDVLKYQQPKLLQLAKDISIYERQLEIVLDYRGYNIDTADVVEDTVFTLTEKIGQLQIEADSIQDIINETLAAELETQSPANHE